MGNEKQQNLEWFSQRIGKITASNFFKVMGNTAKPTQTTKSFLNKILAERLTGLPEIVSGKALTWGNLYEEFAIKRYSELTKKEVTNVGFIDADIKNVGGSPDGIIEKDNGIIEVKCPYNSTNHVETILNDTIKKEYIAQIQGNIWITKADYCDFISYDPRIDKDCAIKVIRILPDLDYIEKLKENLNFYLEWLDWNYLSITGEKTFTIEKAKLEYYLIENFVIEESLEGAEEYAN